MKHVVSVLFVSLCSSVLFAQTPPASYQITGSVRTIETNKSDKIERAHGDVRMKEKEQILKMELRRTNPNAPSNAKVYWVLAMEDMQGRLRPTGGGTQQIHTQVGIPVELQSDSFTLKERNWNGNGGNNATREQDIKGYAVVVVDENGNELGFKCTPSSLTEDARAYFEGQMKQSSQPQQGREAVRPTRPRERGQRRM